MVIDRVESFFQFGFTTSMDAMLFLFHPQQNLFVVQKLWRFVSSKLRRAKHTISSKIRSFRIRNVDFVMFEFGLKFN